MAEIKIEGEGENLSQEIRILSAIGYLPMLFFLPLILRPKDGFCRFHGIQSLVILLALATVWVAIYILDFILGKVLGSMILWGFIFKITAWLVHYVAGTAISILYILLIIYCFIQAAAGQRWRVPVLGAYAERLHIRYE
ncbi:MAG: hypothetical protein ABIK42_07025 [candidate division WOR-3 bacterium]